MFSMVNELTRPLDKNLPPGTCPCFTYTVIFLTDTSMLHSLLITSSFTKLFFSWLFDLTKRNNIAVPSSMQERVIHELS